MESQVFNGEQNGWIVALTHTTHSIENSVARNHSLSESDTTGYKLLNSVFI